MVTTQSALEYDFAGSRARILLSGKHTQNSVSVVEMFAPPGKSTPSHAHANEEESLVVLSGALEVLVDGVTIQAKAGENLCLPRGVPHKIMNNSSDSAHYLLVCAPAGFEAFIESVAHGQAETVVPAPPTAEQIGRMRANAGRFGITLLPG